MLVPSSFLCRWCSRLLLILVAFVAACHRPAPQFAPPPPAEVTVARPERRAIERTMEFSGRTRGAEEVELRARVKGFLERRAVASGARVKAGDLCFVIDPREYQAAVDQAKARVASARAQLTLADLTLARAKEAMEAAAATQQEVDQKLAMRDSAKADVDLAEAQLSQATLNLDFTLVRSPIAGRIGMITVDPGQLVGASDATLLATVISDSKIYAEYEIDERTVLALRREFQNRRPGEDGRPNLQLRMQLAGEQGFPHDGVMSSGDNTIDTQTGTVKVEGVFDNPDGEILPGLFVRIQAVFGTAEAWLVPDVAVLSDQIGKYVLVVLPDQSVERRSVEIGALVGPMREVRIGLSAEDRVIINGVQRARPGAKVQATEKPLSA